MQPTTSHSVSSFRVAPAHQGTHDGSALAHRTPELDALRGLAAVAVVVFHANPGWIPLGWSAVDLFFVLSGYLITSIILRHGASAGFLGRFYVRRGLRVWPIYYLVVLALAGSVPWLFRRYDYAGLPYVLTFTQGIRLYWDSASPVFSYYLGHTWTLAIEEQFYLLWPAALLLLGLGRVRVGALALACAIGSAVARARGLNLSLLAGRGDGLALGGLLACLLLDGNPASRRSRWLTAGFAGITLASLLGLGWVAIQVGLTSRSHRPPWPGSTIFGLSCLYFGIVGLAVCQSGRRWLRLLRSEPLRRLGEMSYGLYLYHLPILLLVGDLARSLGRRGAPFWRQALALGLCFVVARLSWHWIEKPILRLKDRFAYQTDRLANPPYLRASASSGQCSTRSDVPADR